MISRLALATAALAAGISALPQAVEAAAAQQVENVCLITYAYAKHALANDSSGITAASYMPRETAAKIADDYSKIYAYPDAATTMRACQCYANPWPANNLTEREAALGSCPKPTRIE